MSRAHNFSAGPAAIPLAALERAREELLDVAGSGMSVMELSHRGKEYEAIHAEAKSLLIELLDIPSTHHVLFLQGGASLQFDMIPMNFLDGASADYVVTGSWAKKAYKEAKLFGTARVAATSEETNFDRIPALNAASFDAAARYVHITSNNTIFGTQYATFPEATAPLVADMSSDIVSRPVDVSKFALIYAGAQKNLGPSGVTVVIVSDEFLQTATKRELGAMLRYETHVKENSLYNTPPTFGIYMLRNVLDWVKAEGGLTGMAARNEKKAALLYEAIDGSGGFYRGHAQVDSRSRMNVAWRLPSEDLEKAFLNACEAERLVQLKGHRSVGGIRASIYNAMEYDSVKLLCDLMRDFAAKNG
ncbi:3-phosphoserine/phosphohydroxythreonine transaminase [bacterium]|nr:3-phosphoserine/phosphohydroxythreonine transaminase [bacterium]